MDERDTHREFGRRFRRLRKERNLSQEKLSELAGLDRTYISQVENGANVTLATIHKLAGALGVDPAALFSDECPPSRK